MSIGKFNRTHQRDKIFNGKLTMLTIASRRKFQGRDIIHGRIFSYLSHLPSGNTPLCNGICPYLSHLPSGNAILIHLQVQFIEPELFPVERISPKEEAFRNLEMMIIMINQCSLGK